MPSRTRPAFTAVAAPAVGEIAATLQSRLLAFFDQHARDLPWRHDCDGYRV